MDIAMKYWRALVEVLKLYTQPWKFAQHTKNLEGILKNVCSISNAIVYTGLVLVSSFVQWGVRMIHIHAIRIDISAWCMKIMRRNVILKPWLVVCMNLSPEYPLRAVRSFEHLFYSSVNYKDAESVRKFYHLKLNYLDP